MFFAPSKAFDPAGEIKAALSAGERNLTNKITSLNKELSTLKPSDKKYNAVKKQLADLNTLKAEVLHDVKNIKTIQNAFTLLKKNGFIK